MSAMHAPFDDEGPGLLPPSARALMDAPRNAPRVLLIDHDGMAALALAVLLTPEAQLSHVTTVAAARLKLHQAAYGLVIIDPQHLEGDIAGLLTQLVTTPLLVYSAQEPSWREYADDFLPKPWTSPRKLWSCVARALGLPSPICIGA